jgi:hypothetical protein
MLASAPISLPTKQTNRISMSARANRLVEVSDRAKKIVTARASLRRNLMTGNELRPISSGIIRALPAPWPRGWKFKKGHGRGATRSCQRLVTGCAC